MEDPGGDQEWLTQLAAILAVGLMRALARKSSGKEPVSGESSLDFSVAKSGHSTPSGSGASDD